MGWKIHRAILIAAIWIAEVLSAGICGFIAALALIPASYAARGYISSIDAFYYSGKYTLTVRTVSSGGLYLPIVAEQTAQAVFDKAAELGITLSEYKVEEFSEGNSSKVENLILWKSADGVTGTYTDDTGSSPYIETDVTIERLAEIVR